MPIEGTAVLGGRYALEEVIGRGGMAEVYRASDQVLSRPVAVKLLRETADDESDRARFTAEARTLARLSHPNLVTVLDAGTADERPYLVMELVDGQSLAAVLSGRALHISRVVQVGIQVAEALSHIHAAGVIHRDIKPGNVLLGSDGRVRLTDFGIARLIGDTTRHTRTGLTIGSPAYLSPEQVRGAEVTTATDVYSLGLVLIEALTGRQVYTGTPTESALARLHAPPAVPEDLPAGWRRLLVSMTSLEPDQRPRASEVAATLRRIDQDPTEVQEAAGATSVLPMADHAEPARRGGTTDVLREPGAMPSLGSKRLWWVVGALVALIVAVLLVAMLATSAQNPATEEQLPPGVPERLEEPLRDLHDAVEGRAQ